MHLRWKKKLGQHLLYDRNILKKIVSALKLRPGESVVEIGSGSGALTEFLVAEPVNVLAVEFDPQFFDILSQRFGGLDNFTLISGNILNLQLKDMLPENIKAVVTGNVPYNITSQILFHLFRQRDEVSRMVFTVQKEVAQRMRAPVKTKDRGILSILCQFHAVPQMLFPVSRNCFYPKPKVDSAVIALELKTLPDDVVPDKLMPIVKTCFGQRRKTLRNSLPSLSDNQLNALEHYIELNRRPEELKVEEFLELTRIICAHDTLLNSARMDAQ